jgi:hypothetical protein
MERAPTRIPVAYHRCIAIYQFHTRRLHYWPHHQAQGGSCVQYQISYVKAQHVYPCAGSATSIGLADLDGRPLLELASTTDSYRSAVFGANGTRWPRRSKHA